jgi:hypothetical protein
MVLISADKAQVERSLRRVVALSEKFGAEFSDDLTLKCVDGFLSVEAPPETAGKLLARLPWNCLVPLPSFHLSIASDDIVISSHDEGLTGECVSIMEALLELYNLTGKLAYHRRTSPWLLLASFPQILEFIIPARYQAGLALQNLLTSGSNDKIMLQSFLNSRVLNYFDSTKSPPYPVLMPVIDLFNHDFQGALFEINQDHNKEGSVAITRSVPSRLTGSECFACYGAHDSFDTWLLYGFIDLTAPFVASIAMTIELPTLGRIELTNTIRNREPRTLPAAVSDVSFYTPAVLAKNGDSINVARLVIPGPAAPKALRRTLHFLISEMHPGHAKKSGLVMQAEEQILTANYCYYRDLTRFLQGLHPEDPVLWPILNGFIRLCYLQLARIAAYRGYARG